jgi:carotenoid cleavage dioxygenase-like enzyme
VSLCIAVQLDKMPYFRFHVVGADGQLVRSFPITGVTKPIMAHDFAITKK